MNIVALCWSFVERLGIFLRFLPSPLRAYDCACAGACSGRHGGILGRSAIGRWLLARWTCIRRIKVRERIS